MIYICLILLLVVVGEFFYFSKLIDDKKKHIFTLTKENDALKKKFRLSNPKEPLSITFSYVTYQIAEVNANTSMYIAPLPSAQPLCLFKTPQKITILCKGEINNEVWYEAELNASSRINTRGWIKASSVTFIDHSLMKI